MKRWRRWGEEITGWWEWGHPLGGSKKLAATWLKRKRGKCENVWEKNQRGWRQDAHMVCWVLETLWLGKSE